MYSEIILTNLFGVPMKIFQSIYTPINYSKLGLWRHCKRQHDELVAKATKGMPGAPHAEHQSLCEAIFNKRFEIVNGIVEVDSVKNESAEEAKINDLTIEVKGIPDFWMTVLKNSEIYEIAEAGE
ncbi:nucleosome assembly protein 1;2-like isoform X2 [Tasmannia lanceolata]|uniref:nucleosome assembly protein 1;2-like isoform X2 n=1 Tax=Tasmannia lanceolata TaxID=3420 RepID=UPI00406332AF